MEDKFKPPKPSIGDGIHASARAGLGTIPVVGAAATELLNWIVTPPLEKRKNAWMERVGNSLRKFEESKGICLEDMQNNDLFLDIALQASHIALRTSQEEKLEALKNAILNATLAGSPDESIQQMFLGFIDYFTVWHLKLLTFLDTPKIWAKKYDVDFSDVSRGSQDVLIERAFPELRNKRDLYELWGKDLHVRGLINTDNFHMHSQRDALLERKSTALGRQFMLFVTDPAEKK